MTAPADSIGASFKLAMRRLTSTITIVTTEEEGVWHGMVATAVCSVGIDPPSLLICVNQSASIHAPLLRRRAFGVNLLTPVHAGLVAAFSGKLKGQARFESGGWTTRSSGLPVLADAQASLVCEVSATLDHACHTVFIGRVLDIAVQAPIQPLLYQDASLVVSSPLSMQAAS